MPLPLIPIVNQSGDMVRKQHRANPARGAPRGTNPCAPLHRAADVEERRPSERGRAKRLANFGDAPRPPTGTHGMAWHGMTWHDRPSDMVLIISTRSVDPHVCSCLLSRPQHRRTNHACQIRTGRLREHHTAHVSGPRTDERSTRPVTWNALAGPRWSSAEEDGPFLRRSG